MPSYKVIEKGFYGGRIYDPHGKRRVLHTDKPFPKKNNKEQVPSWLEPITNTETAAEKKKREAAEKKAAKAAADKAEQDQKDIADASFMGEGEKASSAVETL
jgi:hypothetical protein